jgi:DNA polymerase-1
MCGEQLQPDAGQSGKGGVLLLIDGHAYAYRAFFAIRKLNAPDGKPTNAIYGFVKMVSKLRDRLCPSHAAVIWDGGIAQSRLDVLPDYKAHRPPMPEALGTQLGEIERFLAAARIPSFRWKGVEADDGLATFVHKFAQTGMRIVIASPDKDFMQLVSASVGLINAGEASPHVWNEADVHHKTGVRPEQVVDWLSLMGDAVDNIPGVPGIGPKTASKLLADFGSIQGLYEQIDRVGSERLQAQLKGAADVVARNQGLIRLEDELEIPVDLEQLALRSGDEDELRALYRTWGFKSLVGTADAGPVEQEQDLFAAVRD